MLLGGVASPTLSLFVQYFKLMIWEMVRNISFTKSLHYI